MKRRDVLRVLSGAAAWPLTARAQETGRVYRVGFFVPGSRDMPAFGAFLDELRLNGFVLGQNLAIIPGGFLTPQNQYSAWAAELVNAAPDAIVGGPDPQLRALQALTRTIPIISMTEDVVASGFAASLAKPGSNITGISLLSPELDGKRQDLLTEAAPNLRRMAAFSDSRVTPARHLQSLQDAARARGVELSVFNLAKPDEIAPAINAAKVAGVQAINFLATPLFGAPSSRVTDLVELLRTLRLPAIHQWPETVDEGGLMGYGARFTEMWRQRARMLVKVLRGAKPADLPIEQPTRFELAINLKTAKAIGHEVPANLVLRADKLIE